MWEPTSETNYFFVEKNVTTQKFRVLLPIRFEKKYISYIDNEPVFLGLRLSECIVWELLVITCNFWATGFTGNPQASA